jgi:hypothetical protein
MPQTQTMVTAIQRNPANSRLQKPIATGAIMTSQIGLTHRAVTQPLGSLVVSRIAIALPFAWD